MKTLPLLLSLVMPASVFCLPDDALAGKGEKEKKPAEVVKILAQGLFHVSPEKKPAGIQEVITSAECLAKLLDEKDADRAVASVREALKVDRIDFRRQMLLAVSMGPEHGRPLELEVEQITVERHTMKVDWRIKTLTESIETPKEHTVCIVLLPKFDGKVVFSEPSQSRR